MNLHRVAQSKGSSDDGDDNSETDSKHGPGSRSSKKSRKKDKRDKKSSSSSTASSVDGNALMTPKDLRAKRRERRRSSRRDKAASGGGKEGGRGAVQKWADKHKLGDDVLLLLTRDFGVEHLSDLKLLEKADFINQGMSKSNVKAVWKAIKSLE